MKLEQWTEILPPQLISSDELHELKKSPHSIEALHYAGLFCGFSQVLLTLLCRIVAILHPKVE